MRSQRAFSWQLRHWPQWQRPEARLDLLAGACGTGSIRGGAGTMALRGSGIASHSGALFGMVSQGSNSCAARGPRRRPEVERKALNA